jgi:type II secretory pathway component PulF
MQYNHPKSVLPTTTQIISPINQETPNSNQNILIGALVGSLGGLLILGVLAAVMFWFLFKKQRGPKKMDLRYGSMQTEITGYGTRKI